MIIDINNYLSWGEFRKQPHVAKLNVNEQMKQYSYYSQQYSLLRMQWLTENIRPINQSMVGMSAGGGGGTPPITYPTSFTVQASDGGIGAPSVFSFDITPIGSQQSSILISWGDGNTNTYTLDTNVGTLTPTHTYSELLVSPQIVNVQISNQSTISDLSFGYYSTGVVDSISGLTDLTSLSGLSLPHSNIQTFNLDSNSVQDFTIENSTNLSNLTIGNTTNLVSFSATSCTSLVDLNIENGNLSNCINFRAANCSILPADQISQILTQLDQNGLSGGTVYLNGGSNAAPDPAGDIAAANLIAKGWSVSTN